MHKHFEEKSWEVTVKERAREAKIERQQQLLSISGVFTVLPLKNSILRLTESEKQKSLWKQVVIRELFRIRKQNFPVFTFLSQ